jgi:predicted enzyme related to lactoylglutathione lyase
MSDGVTPPCWTLYLAADDADQTAAAISENGGTILYPPMDVGPMGRMLIAADPTGAAFGVWQAGTRIGSELVNQPGGLTWEDLRSPDPAAAQAFYTTIFGFSTAEIEMAGPDYRTFAHPEKPDVPLGGMGPMMGADGAGAHWLIYFGVADAEAAVSAATANGGQVVAPAFASPYGTMAGLADPAGAVFWVVETTDDDPAGRAG